jgi:predicted HD superfamily hydrolase involved in NAD metabolism
MRSPGLTAAVDALARESLGDARYRHCLRVAELARELCLRFALEGERGYLAGLGHDVARELEGERITALAEADGAGITALEARHPMLLHGRASAQLLSVGAGVADAGVLQAVRDHVAGRPGMGPLSCAVMAADYLEPGRDFITEGDRRRILGLTLGGMVRSVLEGKIHYVRAGGRPVSASTLLLLEELKRHAG